MANPREIAEQAFALLQNALSESEARASDLDDQLKRKRAPKNRLEEQLDVLTHRLESVEAERQRWEQQAGHLEEIAEAERVKVAQLKKKLEIAESGPEKLTKKEVNFWRAKSETIDAQVKEYQERLTALRRELAERDALIDKLQASGAHAEPAPPPQESAADSELRRQLEQRDQWLAELRLELHELRAQPAPPLETQAEVETLRSQITELERALSESHNLRAAAQADLIRAEHEIAARERAMRETMAAGERNLREAVAASERNLREAVAAGEHVRATLAEREHRIAELAAEAEHLRTDLRQRDEIDRADVARYEEQIAALSRDAEALRGRIEQDRHDTGAARAALEIALHEREHEVDKQRQLLAANERDFEELRRQLAERDHVAAETRRNLEEQRQELLERDRELADSQHRLRELSDALGEREQRLDATTGELEHLRATITAQAREIESLRETLQNAQRELDEQRSAKQEAMTALEAANARVAAAAADMEAAREQVAGLEAELKEEREHAESLGELANERREHMTKLQEQVEEAEERYADANWRLGKSLHFERIVKRRKTLIKKLLEAIRAKMKANVALKAGIDGLRTFKQTAEMNQHKLLQRIDSLKAELKEAEEIVKRHQGATVAKEELTTALARAAALEERLNTQAELIQQLEADLKTAKLSHKPAAEQTAEVERLTKELEAKNEIIAKLQADTDEQQRKLAKLRGSEGETQRLKALTEKDHAEIDALQREVAQLREALARQSAVAAASGNNAELEAKLKERENSVTRLMGTIKEHESTIKKLTESAESWKRKYQFLATDQPDAYKSGAEK
jgi:chromosome segregation ATPase